MEQSVGLGATHVAITVDLGRVEPIGGVSLRTAAGAVGVMWPKGIRILVSDDGASYRDCGDLIALDRKNHGPAPDGYVIRRLSTSDLRTHGRYIRFLVIPDGWIMVCNTFFFCDEN